MTCHHRSSLHLLHIGQILWLWNKNAIINASNGNNKCPLKWLTLELSWRILGQAQHSLIQQFGDFRVATELRHQALNIRIDHIKNRVATPGRLLDHLSNTKGFSLRTIKFLVLDEADRLLNEDFEKAIDELLMVRSLSVYLNAWVEVSSIADYWGYTYFLIPRVCWNLNSSPDVGAVLVSFRQMSVGDLDIYLGCVALTWLANLLVFGFWLSNRGAGPVHWWVFVLLSFFPGYGDEKWCAMRCTTLVQCEAIGGERAKISVGCFFALVMGLHVCCLALTSLGIGHAGGDYEEIERGLWEMQSVGWCYFQGYVGVVVRLKMDDNHEWSSTFLLGEVRKLQRACLRNPVKIEAASKYSTVDSLKQQYLFVPAKHKVSSYSIWGFCCSSFFEDLEIGNANRRQCILSTVLSFEQNCYLVYILSEKSGSTSMVFTRTCDSTGLLAQMLRNLGLRAIPISGHMTQAKRLGALNKFKAGECNILVCTDVASRGLDIPSVDMVINYDIPSNSKDYIHRVGRTARAGRSGVAISIVSQYELEWYIQIEKLIGKKLPMFPAQEEEVLMLLERVTEAKRIADMKIKEAGGKKKRRGEDDEVEGIERYSHGKSSKKSKKR
ncbi:hypothetical protein TEA_018119 [Camellia sinensis var. sinensis]|uniref:Helicase C-terminal domain-containing protein n=1 Tax=Camellia sinensis var. sinensis TaxID=542762 RepID=A0A4S4DBV5_CAMSN|nr:hypothetical protein TEA_018119 [Camellia sinensis var. sinensis]